MKPLLLPEDIKNFCKLNLENAKESKKKIPKQKRSQYWSVLTNSEKFYYILGVEEILKEILKTYF